MFTLLAVALLFGSAKAALPQFSWDTLPVFSHSSNSTGQYSDDALKVIAKFQMATIEKWMGYDVKDVDDEDEMVLAMKAIKAVNPKISTYFYMNSHKDLLKRPVWQESLMKTQIMLYMMITVLG